MVLQAGYVGLLSVNIPDECFQNDVSIVVNPAVQSANVLDMEYAEYCDINSTQPSPPPPEEELSLLSNPNFAVLLFVFILFAACTVCLWCARFFTAFSVTNNVFVNYFIHSSHENMPNKKQKEKNEKDVENDTPTYKKGTALNCKTYPRNKR